MSHEQRDETYKTYLQDFKDLSEFARFQETIKWVCKSNCNKNVICATCGQGVQIQLDELIAQIFWIGIKNKQMKQTIISKLTNTRRVLNTNNALDVIKNSTVGEKATGATKKQKENRERTKQ